MNEQVFISHSSLDNEWAGMITETLEKNGIRCWFDSHSIRPGDDYDEEIFHAIKRCPVFLLVLTENAVEATFVIKELGLAVREHKTIIPVKIGQFDLGKFWQKLENVQIYEPGRSWNAAKMNVLTEEIKAKLDLVPVDQPGPPPVSRKPVGGASWTKLAVAVAAVILLAAMGFAAFRVGLIGKSTAEGSFGGSRDKEGAASQESSGAPGENSDSVTASPEIDPDGSMKLTDMHMMDSEFAEVKDEMMNSVGQTYKDVLYVGSYYSTGGNPRVQYYLDGAYSRFSGTLSCPDQMDTGYTCIFQVYLDSEENEPVFSLEMDRSTAPTPFEIDVSGCQTIFICVDVHTSGHNRGEIMISDGLFTS